MYKYKSYYPAKEESLGNLFKNAHGLESNSIEDIVLIGNYFIFFRLQRIHNMVDINNFHINLFYKLKDKSLNFSRKTIENWRILKNSVI